MHVFVAPLALHSRSYRVHHHRHQAATEGAVHRIPRLRKSKEYGRTNGYFVSVLRKFPGLVLKCWFVDDVVQEALLEQAAIKHHDRLVSFQLLKSKIGHLRVGNRAFLCTAPKDFTPAVTCCVDVTIVITLQ